VTGGGGERGFRDVNVKRAGLTEKKMCVTTSWGETKEYSPRDVLKGKPGIAKRGNHPFHKIQRERNTHRSMTHNTLNHVQMMKLPI